VSRDPKLYLTDIVEACRRIERFTSGRDDEAVLSDEIVRDAVLYNIVVIGEAAAQLSRSGIEARLPAIQWTRIRGMRNILAHEYFGVDRDLVLEVVRQKIPELRLAIEAALADPKLPWT
jgi:uncharacterized protein with HEPN domain